MSARTPSFRGLPVLLAAVMIAVGISALGSASAGAESTSGATRILITGDSITQGSSGDYTWRYRLWSKLQTTAPEAVRFVGTRIDLFNNVSDVYGSDFYFTAFAGANHASRWGGSFDVDGPGITEEVSQSDPDVLVVMLGSNDMTFTTSPADTISKLGTYVDAARSAKPGIDVVVGEVLNRYDGWSGTFPLTAESQEYATRLAAFAASTDTPDERVVVAKTLTGWDARVHTWDGTHPNSTGESYIAQRVSEALASLRIGTNSPDIAGPTLWDMPGSPVTLDGGIEQVGIRWDRQRAGATGMFIETRRESPHDGWTRLPYAVAGDGWVSADLDGGGTYEYRVVPTKGSMTGVAGPSASVTVRARPRDTTTKLESNASLVFGDGGLVTATVDSTSATGTATLTGLPGEPIEASVEGGVAHFAIPSSTPAGTYSLTGAYHGDEVHVASTSPAIRLVIDRARTTVTVVMAGTKYGTPAQARITVTGPRTPTGTVTVSAHGVARSARLDGRGTATLALPRTLAVGLHGVTIAYAGDRDLRGSSVKRGLAVGHGVTPRPAFRILGPAKTTKRAKALITVATPSGLTKATGPVRVVLKRGGSRKAVTMRLHSGRGRVQLPKLAKGRWTVAITHLGDASYARSSTLRMKLTVR